MSAPEYVYVVVIAAPRESVWEALTLGEFTRQYWHGTRVQSDWQPGSPVRFVTDAEEVACEGSVLEAHAPAFLSYTWRFPNNFETRNEPHSRVSFVLEDLAGRTKLTIRHDRFEPGSRTYHLVSGGWPFVLAGLKTLLETGRAVDFTRGSRSS